VGVGVREEERKWGIVGVVEGIRTIVLSSAKRKIVVTIDVYTTAHCTWLGNCPRKKGSRYWPSSHAADEQAPQTRLGSLVKHFLPGSLDLKNHYYQM
jgi:hypothetical protein